MEATSLQRRGIIRGLGMRRSDGREEWLRRKEALPLVRLRCRQQMLCKEQKPNKSIRTHCSPSKFRQQLIKIELEMTRFSYRVLAR
jgi:hypothetical protein